MTSTYGKQEYETDSESNFNATDLSVSESAVTTSASPSLTVRPPRRPASHEESDGAVVSFAGGFKAPLMVRKSDGGYGYGTTDLAAAEYRAKDLRADRVIYFVDARQAQHFKQVFATYAAAVEKGRVAWRTSTFEHASFGSVLGDNGKPLATRSGENVKLAELLDEAVERALPVVESHSAELPEDEKREIARLVGIGAVKYADLSEGPHERLRFQLRRDARLQRQHRGLPHVRPRPHPLDPAEGGRGGRGVVGQVVTRARPAARVRRSPSTCWPSPTR